MVRPFASLLTKSLFMVGLSALLICIVHEISQFETTASGWSMEIYPQRGAAVMPDYPHIREHEEDMRRRGIKLYR
ncbi:MAG: hypothetical protein JWN70_1259 [Planctomycetaceae bacterium]|nr:hypothetical protein [Planctomycetaceae bacterium]